MIKKIGSYSIFLGILVCGSSLMGQDLTDVEAEFYSKLRDLIRYEVARYEPILENQVELEKQLQEAKKKTEDFLNYVKENPDEAGALTFSIFKKTQGSGGKARLINFAGLYGLEKDQFLPVVREIIKKSDSASNDTSLLARSIIYITRNGESEDIELLQYLSSKHSSYGINQIAKGAIGEIQKREGKNGGKDKELPKSQPTPPTPEPTFAKKPPVPDKKPAGAEAGGTGGGPSPFPWRVLIIGGIVILGLAITVLSRRR